MCTECKGKADTGRASGATADFIFERMVAESTQGGTLRFHEGRHRFECQEGSLGHFEDSIVNQAWPQNA
jgi:hypothetical protein